ncbi:MAG: low specificity L-threonine aldolase [Pseudomonadota bacterium]
MNFGSDNTGPVHPRVMEALARANDGYALPYGDDPLTLEAEARIRDVFEAPEAAVFLVPTGSAANSLALACLVQPWQNIYCSAVAHIHADECGAPEFYTGGAKLVLVPETHAKITPTALEATITEGLDRGLHYTQPGAVSLTQVTERGTVYSLAELRTLTDTAHAHGLPVHLDGARFANAMMALDCTAAEMTWKAGIDAVSFGGTKNGLMGVEAIVVFDPAHAESLIYRRKRAGHLFSKQRYLAAQMVAYLDDDLWRTMAAAANAMMARLADGLRALPGAVIHHPVDANMIFVSLPRATHRKALAGGASYFMAPEDLNGGAEDDPIPTRLICNWATTDADVDHLLALMSG